MEEAVPTDREVDVWSISAKKSLEPGVAGNRLLGTVPQDQTRTFSLRGAGGDHPNFDVTRPLQSTVWGVISGNLWYKSESGHTQSNPHIGGLGFSPALGVTSSRWRQAGS